MLSFMGQDQLGKLGKVATLARLHRLFQFQDTKINCVNNHVFGEKYISLTVILTISLTISI